MSAEPRGTRVDRSRVAACLLGVLLIAFAARLGPVLRHGGLNGTYGYDPGVYFAGADAFVHGRLPYRDFVLLHPPLLMLVLAPFALLTHVMSDSAAFTVAALAFCLLGAVNATLVTAVARRLGLPLRAAVLGGLFHALWFGAVGAEHLIKLETLGTTLLLLAGLASCRAGRSGRRRDHVLTGVLIGLVATTKLWWFLPAVLLVVWHRRRTGRWAATTGAAVAAVVAVDLPFFAPAPGAMWQSVVTDQLGRPDGGVGVAERLAQLSTVSRLTGELSAGATLAVAAAFLAATVAVCVGAARTSRGRPVVALFVVQLAVLLAAPSWYPPYSGYVAAAAALTVAHAAAGARRPLLPGALLAVPAGLTVAIVVTGSVAVNPVRGQERLAAAVAPYRCVVSDTPALLIRLNALSRGLRDGCPNWIDVTGRTYGADRADVPRARNAAWQRSIRAYLTSGDALVLGRVADTGLSPATLRAVTSGRVLVRAGGRTVYLTPPR